MDKGSVSRRYTSYFKQTYLTCKFKSKHITKQKLSNAEQIPQRFSPQLALTITIVIVKMVVMNRVYNNNTSNQFKTNLK